MTPQPNQNSNAANTRSHIPFWKPWGPWGCLWRTLLFLLGMILIALLMALLLKGCENPIPEDPFVNPITQPDDPYKDLPPELRDSSSVDDWNKPIPGVDELPEPDDNYIPPVDSSDIITDPEDSLTQIVKNHLVVTFNVKLEEINNAMASFAKQFKQNYPQPDYKVLYYNTSTAMMLLQVPDDKLEQMCNELPQKITDIDFYVTTDAIMNSSFKPSDPGFAMPWNDEYFKLIQTYEAWDITQGDSSVTVGIVDSFFDLSNPEIGERFRDPINIGTKKKYVLPPSRRPANADEAGLFSHGSHVAGLAIGAQNNKLGASGIAPKCKWIPVALGDYPWTTMKVYEGVLYAIYHGADVINMSLGSSEKKHQKTPLADQVNIVQNTGKRAEKMWDYILKTADAHNCVIVKAAGNDSVLMGLDFQNRSKMVVSVEAVDGKGQATYFSSYGRVPEANMNFSTVAAPGEMLWSVAPKNCIPIFAQEFKKNGINLPTDAKTGFMPMQGTSMACPVVAGAVALLKSKKKDLTTDQVIKILTMTAKQTDTKHRIGPTIQIKDALNMTGGELANFDDLMKNHKLLIGKWKSTHELNVMNEKGERIDDVWSYFIFPSENTGHVEYHGINTKRIHKADINVEWRKDRIIFHQPKDAVSANGDTMSKDEFVCYPNQDRLLEVSVQRNGKERFRFMLEKVN